MALPNLGGLTLEAPTRRPPVVATGANDEPALDEGDEQYLKDVKDIKLGKKLAAQLLKIFDMVTSTDLNEPDSTMPDKNQVDKIFTVADSYMNAASSLFPLKEHYEKYFLLLKKREHAGQSTTDALKQEMNRARDWPEFSEDFEDNLAAQAQAEAWERYQRRRPRDLPVQPEEEPPVRDETMTPPPLSPGEVINYRNYIPEQVKYLILEPERFFQTGYNDVAPANPQDKDDVIETKGSIEDRIKNAKDNRQKAWTELQAAVDAAEDERANPPSEFASLVLAGGAALQKWLLENSNKIRWETNAYMSKELYDLMLTEGKKLLNYFDNPTDYPAIDGRVLDHAIREGKVTVRTPRQQQVYEKISEYAEKCMRLERIETKKRIWQGLRADMFDADGNFRGPPQHLLAYKGNFRKWLDLVDDLVKQNVKWQDTPWTAYALTTPGPENKHFDNLRIKNQGVKGLQKYAFAMPTGVSISLRCSDEEADDPNVSGGVSKYLFVQHLHVPFDQLLAITGGPKNPHMRNADTIAKFLGEFCTSRFRMGDEYHQVDAYGSGTHSGMLEGARHVESAESQRPNEWAERRKPDETRDLDPWRLEAPRRIFTSSKKATHLESESPSRGTMAFRGGFLNYGRSEPGGSGGFNRQEQPAVFRDDGLLRYGHNTPLPPTRADGDIYDEYVAYKRIARNFIEAFEASEEWLVPQGAKERRLVSRTLDPKGCLRQDPTRVSFAFTLTSGFLVSPHDDSGSAIEYITFGTPSTHRMPDGHANYFACSGHVLRLPDPRVPKKSAALGEPVYAAGIVAVPGSGVYHGMLPTMTPRLLDPKTGTAEKDMWTYSHDVCGSALVTKVLPTLIRRRKAGLKALGVEGFDDQNPNDPCWSTEVGQEVGNEIQKTKDFARRVMRMTPQKRREWYEAAKNKFSGADKSKWDAEKTSLDKMIRDMIKDDLEGVAVSPRDDDSSSVPSSPSDPSSSDEEEEEEEPPSNVRKQPRRSVRRTELQEAEYALAARKEDYDYSYPKEVKDMEDRASVLAWRLAQMKRRFGPQFDQKLVDTWVDDFFEARRSIQYASDKVARLKRQDKTVEAPQASGTYSTSPSPDPSSSEDDLTTEISKPLEMAGATPSNPSVGDDSIRKDYDENIAKCIDEAKELGRQARAARVAFRAQKDLKNAINGAADFSSMDFKAVQRVLGELEMRIKIMREDLAAAMPQGNPFSSEEDDD